MKLIAGFCLWQNVFLLDCVGSNSWEWSVKASEEWNLVWLMASSLCPQRRRRGEALRHLQHAARLRLRRALQPVQQPEGPGAPLPPGLPGAAQRLAQRAPRIPRLRTDALRTQMNPTRPATPPPPPPTTTHTHRQEADPSLGKGEWRREEGDWLKYKATPTPPKNTRPHKDRIKTLAATHTSATLEFYIFTRTIFGGHSF